MKKQPYRTRVEVLGEDGKPFAEVAFYVVPDNTRKSSPKVKRAEERDDIVINRSDAASMLRDCRRAGMMPLHGNRSFGAAAVWAVREKMAAG